MGLYDNQNIFAGDMEDETYEADVNYIDMPDIPRVMSSSQNQVEGNDNRVTASTPSIANRNNNIDSLSEVYLILKRLKRQEEDIELERQKKIKKIQSVSNIGINIGKTLYQQKNLDFEKLLASEIPEYTLKDPAQIKNYMMTKKYGPDWMSLGESNPEIQALIDAPDDILEKTMHITDKGKLYELNPEYIEKGSFQKMITPLDQRVQLTPAGKMAKDAGVKIPDLPAKEGSILGVEGGYGSTLGKVGAGIGVAASGIDFISDLNKIKKAGRFEKGEARKEAWQSGLRTAAGIASFVPGPVGAVGKIVGVGLTLWDLLD